MRPQSTSKTKARPSMRHRSVRSQPAPDRSPWQRGLGVGLVIAALVLSGFVSFTAFEVLTNFRDVRAKASDNVDWSLSQVELEARDFTSALETAILDPDRDLSRLRLRYDILYSRVITISTSPVYQRLTTLPEFDEALNRVLSLVLETVDIIDAPDAELRAALPELAKSAEDLRNDTRTMSLQGLIYFAEQADRQRADVTDTLLRLTALIVLLLIALVALVVHAFNIYRLSRRHSVALSEANSRMSTILTTSLDGVLVTDQDGRVLEFNKACEDMFQYKFEDIRGRNVLNLISPPETRDIHASAMQRILSGGTGHYAGRGRVRVDLRRADGTIFPGEISVEVAEENGQLIFLGFMHDISDRVAAEQELVETRDQALAGERAKAEFLTVMSHEIRTPLNGILGNLSLLNDTALSTAQTRYIRNMEISGRVLMRHVDTVLDIARHEAGVLNIKLACTDLSILLQELIDSQLSAASARANALSWRWEGTPRTWVRTDRAALEQVLLNLIGNAIKFTHKGAITVEAEALPESFDGVPVIEIRVCDTGIGISEDRQEKVFEDFVTNDTGLGQVPGGTGLGLGIARRIVTAMGGTIGVESAPGKGSVFWVRLPMAPGRQPPLSAKSHPPAKPLRRRVLLVEDNAINRELAVEMLRNAGHEVIAAKNGAEGVDIAEKKRFDMILMDIAMPVMDGLQATLAIRSRQGPNAKTPIIAVSANILPAERKRLKKAGMNGFLAKPLDRAALQSTLQELHTLDSGGDDAPSEAAKTPVVVDIKTLTNNSSGLPSDTFSRLLSRFLSEGDALIDGLTTAPKETDTLAKMCHNLAGAAAIFGARSLHAKLVEADSAAKSQDNAGFENALVAIPAIWRDTRAALADHLPSDAAE